MEDFAIDCVSGKKEDYIQGESNRNYIHLAISEKDELCSVDLDKDKAKELINYLTKFVEQPEPLKKVEGWVNVFNGCVSRVYESKEEARIDALGFTDVRQVRIEEVE